MDPLESHEWFHHQPLDLTTNSFRLFNIRRLSNEGLVECTIEIHDRDQKHLRYSALSYAWGPQEFAGLILLNGKPFPVRQNLLRFIENALLSHPDACTRIWIDALCIDQENNCEKTHQVMQMASIYNDAEKVFVWLGRSGGDYKRLFRAITHSQKDLWQCQDPPLSIVAQSKLFLEDNPLPHQVQDLLTREYWERMWIIQEVTLAQHEPELICGEHRFEWSAIKTLVTPSAHERSGYYSSLLKHWSEYHIGMALRVIRIRERFSSASNERGMTVLQLLVNLDGLGACSDPRDKVYSLLGLLRHPGHLCPDYSISPETLFFRVLQDESLSSETAHVVLRDAFILKTSLGVDFVGLRNSLIIEAQQNPSEKVIWFGHQPFLRQPFWALLDEAIWKKVFIRGLEYHFHHDQSIGTTTWLLDPTNDVILEFASFGHQNEFRKAIILRKIDERLFKYVAMAEYLDAETQEWQGNHYPASGQWFLYHLPTLLSADYFPSKGSRINLSAEVFLVLMKLCELGRSIGDPRVLQKDLEFLGIRERFIIQPMVITHSTLFTPTKPPGPRTAPNFESTRLWPMDRHEISTHKVYNGRFFGSLRTSPPL